MQQTVEPGKTSWMKPGYQLSFDLSVDTTVHNLIQQKIFKMSQRTSNHLVTKITPFNLTNLISVLFCLKSFLLGQIGLGHLA